MMTSAETESRVTKTASFLVVPVSRREWASTSAPLSRESVFVVVCRWLRLTICREPEYKARSLLTGRTREIVIAEQ